MEDMARDTDTPDIGNQHLGNLGKCIVALFP